MNKPSIQPSLIVGLPERSGFLLPALTLWTATVINLAARKEQLGINDLLSILEAKSMVSITGLTLVAIYTIFLLGHIIDLLSNGINERFLANKMDGYPHERIVPKSNTTEDHKNFNYRRKTNLSRISFFFEGAKLLIASSTLYVLVRLLERHPKLLDVKNSESLLQFLNNYAALGLTVSIVIAIPSVLVLYFPYDSADERKRIAEHVVLRIKRVFRRNRYLYTVSRAWNFAMLVILGPLIHSYELFDKLIQGMIRLNLQIDLLTYSKVQDASRKIMGLEFDRLENNDRFWLPYLSIHKRAPQLAAKVDEVKKFANFCRNQSFACFMSAMLISGVYTNETTGRIGAFTKNDLSTLSLLLFAAAWLFHWKFLHHYYSFTKMTFRAFALLANGEIPNASTDRLTTKIERKPRIKPDKNPSQDA